MISKTLQIFTFANGVSNQNSVILWSNYAIYSTAVYLTNKNTRLSASLVFAPFRSYCRSTVTHETISIVRYLCSISFTVNFSATKSQRKSHIIRIYCDGFRYYQ